MPFTKKYRKTTTKKLNRRIKNKKPSRRYRNTKQPARKTRTIFYNGGDKQPSGDHYVYYKIPENCAEDKIFTEANKVDDIPENEREKLSTALLEVEPVVDDADAMGEDAYEKLMLNFWSEHNNRIVFPKIGYAVAFTP